VSSDPLQVVGGDGLVVSEGGEVVCEEGAQEGDLVGEGGGVGIGASGLEVVVEGLGQGVCKEAVFGIGGNGFLDGRASVFGAESGIGEGWVGALLSGLSVAGTAGCSFHDRSLLLKGD
jgi:hypothetical protein